MRLLRHGDRVTVRVAKWDDSKIGRRVDAVINTNSLVSKIPAKIWQELDVKPCSNTGKLGSLLGRYYST